MRVTTASVANGIAWTGLLALIGAALWVVRLLGFPGVLILGLLTCLVCVRAELSEEVSSWSQAVFAAWIARDASPEARAARQAAREEWLSPLRYYRGCGFVLVVAGLLGTVWELAG